MSDIVERLRETAGWVETQSGCFDGIMLDAAVEIERLRSLAGKAEVGQSFAEIAPRYPAPRDGDPSMND